MPLTGQAKTDYQREYMRKRRSNARSNSKPVSVRPKPVRPLEPVRPEGLSDNQWAYVKMKAEEGAGSRKDLTPNGGGPG